MNRKLEPSPFLSGVTAYQTPKTATPVDLYLNGNEGAGPPTALLEEAVKAGVETVRMYPHNAPLESRIAGMIDVDPRQIVVTAGADDALARILRAVLSPGREMVMPVPTFEMIERYARLAGGKLVTVPWLEGSLPVEEIIASTNERTALVTVVTPNSPIGQAAAAGELKALSDAVPQALLLVDLAYIDFADEDLTQFALTLPNTVITRTLSKAWGLAGLRVGWAAGPPEIINWLRAAGQPYSVSSLSLAIADKRLETGGDEVTGFIARVKAQRRELTEALLGLGISITPSQGNFVFPRFSNPSWVRDALAGLGISVRAFPSKPYLEDGMRITVPGNDRDFERLTHGLECALAPEALLFDIDDTLADVTDSYRLATIATAKDFGVDVSFEDITRAKAEGDANNDWVLTQKLIEAGGKTATLDAVTERFEERYQGTSETPGFKLKESLLCSKSLLEELAGRIRLGIVTGRPARDADEFLERQGIRNLFDVVATMEDGPSKPDPAPVLTALDKLGISRAWMVGDTPDDMRAARSAGAVPIGVVAPADDPEVAADALIRAGAGRVLSGLSELKELLS